MGGGERSSKDFLMGVAGVMVGGYTLDLYCDNPKCKNHIDKKNLRYDGPDQFTGETFSQCKRKAKKGGWVFSDDGTILCPRCAGRRER